MVVAVFLWHAVVLILKELVEEALRQLQDEQNFTKLMVAQEELKTMPFNDIWEEYCERCGKPKDGEWFGEVERYESEVLAKRG